MRFYFLYYIMITKFKTLSDYNAFIEVSNDNDYLRISINDEDHGINEVLLSEKDLFNLIGQLLRIQSEIRKESNNG